MNNDKSKDTSINLPNDNQVSFEINQAFEDPDALNIGKTFVEARAKKGLTQEQASSRLKIRLNLIIDFEDGKPLDLPGLAYKIGFVRSYANLLGLDTDFIVEAYKKSIDAHDKRVTYNFLEAKKEKKSYIPFVGLATLLICLVTYSTWYYNSINTKVTDDDNLTKILESEQSTDQVLDYVKIEDQVSSDKSLNQISDKNLSENKISKKVSTVQNHINTDDKKITTENVLSSFDEKIIKNNEIEIENTNEISAVANERDPQTEMVLESSGNSWVEIEDLDGNSLVTRLMRKGETYVIPREKGLTLSTGNAGVLSLTYGDIYISSLGEVGEVITSRPLNIEAFKRR